MVNNEHDPVQTFECQAWNFNLSRFKPAVQHYTFKVADHRLRAHDTSHAATAARASHELR